MAGRYLVFDIDDVAYIRRHHGICAVLTGTMPQNPTQNLFLSLPVELHAEEAKLLVDKRVGYIADELAQHLSQLGTMDEAIRKGYVQHLKQQRRNAQLVFEEAKAEAKAKVQAKHQGKRKAKPAAAISSAAVTETGEESLSLFDDTPPPTTTTPTPAVSKDQDTTTTLPSVTLTTSTSLLPPSPTTASLDTAPAKYPMYRYLNARGYYTTPGLRFGGDYSVYPGDPFRYHAHYLANSYGWDEEVAMLDLVTSGRLGTAVKKGFLFGAEKPGGGGEREGEGEVRVFCIEWAGM